MVRVFVSICITFFLNSTGSINSFIIFLWLILFFCSYMQPISIKHSIQHFPLDCQFAFIWLFIYLMQYNLVADVIMCHCHNIFAIFFANFFKKYAPPSTKIKSHLRKSRRNSINRRNEPYEFEPIQKKKNRWKFRFCTMYEKHARFASCPLWNCSLILFNNRMQARERCAYAKDSYETWCKTIRERYKR